MITVTIKNENVGQDLYFGVREDDINFLHNYKTTPEVRFLGIFKRRLLSKPFQEANAEYFYKYSAKAFDGFCSFFQEIDRSDLQEKFLMLMLYRDRYLQRLFARDYANEEEFLKDFIHRINKYKYPEELLESNPLPTCMTSNLFITLFFFYSNSFEMQVPDAFMPFIFPAINGGIR